MDHSRLRIQILDTLSILQILGRRIVSNEGCKIMDNPIDATVSGRLHTYDRKSTGQRTRRLQLLALWHEDTVSRAQTL